VKLASWYLFPEECVNEVGFSRIQVYMENREISVVWE